MKLIKRIFVVDEIPNNCMECGIKEMCNLPYKYHDRFRKPYLTKRHKECELITEQEYSKA